jgi:hypothetical protein
MEHVWVEAWITYDHYRGAVQTKFHKKWIQMDPSFKQYEYKEGIDLSTAVPFDAETFINELKESATINEEEGYVTNVDQSLIELRREEFKTALEDYINTNLPEGTIGDLLGAKTIKKEAPGILLVTLPYKVINKLNEYSVIPNNLRHKVRFRVNGIDHTVSTLELAGQRVTLSYVYATDEDKAVVEEYGGIYDTPAYLVKLKPLLMIGDEIEVEGEPSGLGLSQSIRIEFIAPGKGVVDIVERETTVGAYYAITFDLQRIPTELIQANISKLKEALELAEIQPVKRADLIGELLNLTGLIYFCQLDIYNYFLSKIHRISYIRHPSEAITSLNLKVDYLFSTPKSVSFSGVGIDIERDVLSAFSVVGDLGKEKNFMVSAGMLGSSLEHGIFELLFNIPSISAVKALQLANEEGMPIYSINENNISQILPKLQISGAVKSAIQNAVNAGNVVTVSGRNIQYNEWNGVGYIIIDPETGDGAYMISGKLAGGVATKLAEALKLGFSIFMNWASEIKESKIAGRWDPVLVLAEFLVEIVSIWSDSAASVNLKEVKILIETFITVTFILLTLIAQMFLPGMIGSIVIIAILPLLAYAIGKFKEWVYEKLGWAFIFPSFRRV